MVSGRTLRVNETMLKGKRPDSFGRVALGEELWGEGEGQQATWS